MKMNQKKLLKSKSIVHLRTFALIAVTVFFQSCSSTSHYEKNKDDNSARLVTYKLLGHSSH
jgi:hypothetical protein